MCYLLIYCMRWLVDMGYDHENCLQKMLIETLPGSKLGLGDTKIRRMVFNSFQPTGRINKKMNTGYKVLQLQLQK